MALTTAVATTPATASPSPSKVVAGSLSPPVGAGQATSLGARPASAPIELNVDLRVREAEALQSLIVAAGVPGTPSYGRHLTEAQYMARFAPTAADVAVVAAWLRSRHLTVIGVSADHLLMHIRGTTAAVEDAFQVAIGQYTASGRTFYAAEEAPSVPADLPIRAVRGLSSYAVPQPAYKCLVAGFCGLDGTELRQAYSMTGTGEGQTIAFTGDGTPITTEYLEAETRFSGVAELTFGSGAGQLEFKSFGEGSLTSGEQASWHEEVALDVEAAHEIAPRAHLLYELALGSSEASHEVAVEDTLDEAASSAATVISDSWSDPGKYCAPNETPKPEQEEGSVYQKAAALGKTFFFSTGDTPPASGCNWPAASEDVVAVGGSELQTAQGSGARVTETADAAKPNLPGANSNCANAIPRGAWVVDIGATSTTENGHNSPCVGRPYPDVAADSCLAASIECGYFVGEEGKSIGKAEGTSLSSPIWAAGTALWNANNAAAGRPGVGFLAPLLYSLGNDPATYARDFYDVTVGGALAPFHAHTGWDQATGWGTPNFTELEANRADLAYTGSTTVAEGQALSVSASLTDHESTNPLAGRTIHFALGGAGCEASTEAAGNARCSLVPLGRGQLTLTANVPGSAAYLEATTTAQVTVDGQPAVQIGVRPEDEAEGEIIRQGSHAATTFSCTAGEHATLEACVDSNGASGGDGALDTSTLGPHTYKVTATDTDGGRTVGSLPYTVAEPPRTRVISPAPGGIYAGEQQVGVQYECEEGAYGTTIAQCVGSGASKSSPGLLDTSTVGPHEFHVTAVSTDGLTGTTSLAYTVASPPQAVIEAPAEGAVVAQGEAVPTAFHCADGSYGSGVSSCEDSGGSTSSIGMLSTDSTGEHEYWVRAVSADGQSTRSAIHYMVVSGPEFGRCVKVASGTGGYSNSKCTTSLSGGRYEWFPGWAKGGVTLSAATTTLETYTRLKVVCSGATGNGSLRGLKAFSATLTLSGCNLGTTPCASGATAGRIESALLDGQLQWVKRSAGTILLELSGHASGAPILSFSCGVESFTVRGELLASLTSDKMTSRQSLKFKAKHGSQALFQYESPGGQTVTATAAASVDGSVYEPIGLTAEISASFEEPFNANGHI